MAHVPVLLFESVELLKPKNGECVLDVTIGLSGHSKEFLKTMHPDGTLVGLDADALNLAAAKKNLEGFRDRVTLIHANFIELPNCLVLPVAASSNSLLREGLFDIIFADLGISSPHLDIPARGFSFRSVSPLDMRLDQSKGMTASELLSSLDESRLLTMFQEFGELPRSRSIVKAIVKRRGEKPILTSDDMKEVAASVFGYKSMEMLPQIFQALRIATNQELAALDHLLTVAPRLLKDGGRLGIISFHSLEDRRVKQHFKALSTPRVDPLTGATTEEAAYGLLTPKAIKPGPEERGKNPRARSARLRAIRRNPVYTPRRS